MCHASSAVRPTKMRVLRADEKNNSNSWTMKATTKMSIPPERGLQMGLNKGAIDEKCNVLGAKSQYQSCPIFASPKFYCGNIQFLQLWGHRKQPKTCPIFTKFCTHTQQAAQNQTNKAVLWSRTPPNSYKHDFSSSFHRPFVVLSSS